MNLSALRAPDYRLYLIGNIFSLHAIWIGRIVLGWVAWAETESAAFVGVVAFLSFAPTMMTGPIFGVLADRVNLRRAGMMVHSIQAGLAAALLMAELSGLLGPALLAAIALGMGVAFSAYHPVRMTLTPSLVARADLSSAITLGSISFNTARLVGPVIGGGLIAGFGPAAAMATMALFFLPPILVLTRIRLRPRRARADSDEPILAALGAGLRLALGERLIRRALILTALFSVVCRGVLEILPVLADGVFARGAAGLGTLTAAAGLGALSSGLMMALGQRQRPGRLPRQTILAAWFGFALVILLGLARDWWLAVAAVALLGFAGTVVGVSLQSLIQMALPDAYRGRVMSLWSLVAIGGTAIGAIVLGALADLVGIGPALMLAGAMGLGIHAVIRVLRWAERRRAAAGGAPPARDASLSPAAHPSPDGVAPQHDRAADCTTETDRHER